MNKDNKYVKYLLLTAVIAVWGIIGWRVFSGLGQGRPPVLATRPPAAVPFAADEDSFVLRADYPDPFLAVDSSQDDERTGNGQSRGEPGTNSRNGMPATGATGQTNGVAVPPPEPLTSWLQFNGLVQSGHKKVALVTIHGTGYLVKERDKVEGITFTRIGKGGIRVRFRDQSYEIRR